MFGLNVTACSMLLQKQSKTSFFSRYLFPADFLQCKDDRISRYNNIINRFRVELMDDNIICQKIAEYLN